MEQPPLFVKIEQYKELVELLTLIDQKIKDSSGLLDQLRKVKAEEDAQLSAWTASLDDVKERTAEIQKTLLKA